MDQRDKLSSPLVGTNSLQSLADGSEAISEAEEIQEVKFLLEQGNEAAETSDCDEAIKHFSEALEIDSQNVDVLKSRALAYLQQHRTEEATRDADTILAINPRTYHGHFIKGLVYEHKAMYKSSLDALLIALDLDLSAPDNLTDHVAKIVSKFCQVSSDLTDNLQALDKYEKLSVLGDILFQNQKYEACISVLEAAGKFQTNQKGFIMQTLLTKARAHSQLLQTEIAIGQYQECLSLAVASHDKAYQTKSLVSIAALYLNSNDIYQAIIFYEKLLHLEAEILAETESEANMPEYWSQDVQCKLHLNLSIAYKTTGNIRSAIVHAKNYIKLTEKFGLEAILVAESHHNLGLLLEYSGNFKEALQCYQEYLALSQCSRNNRGIGQAYGCLARMYAALENWSMSLSLHDQSIATVTTSKDNEMIASAHEIKGDTLCLKGDYEQAMDHYNEMQMLYYNCDNVGYATSFLKMAKVHRSLGQKQSSLYYLKEVLTLAEKFDLREIGTMAEFYAACINKDSSQFMEREEACKSFMRLIPVFETNILQKRAENVQRPDKHEQFLAKCYDGIQTVLSVMANKMECLQYAEAYRRRPIVSHSDADCIANKFGIDSCKEVWDTEYMKRIVSEQNTLILYYSVLESMLLLWVLQPVEGIVHFSYSRAANNQTFSQQISDLLAEMREGWNTLELINPIEARALPPRDQTMDLASQNTRFSTEKPKVTNKASVKNKPVLQRLYDMLVAPVNDILEKLEKGSHLVVVPDKQLILCPFGALLDKTNTPLSNRFRISYIPCLLLLDQVMKNEISSRTTEDDLQFQQQQARKCRLPKEISELSENLTVELSSQDNQDTSELDHLHLNLKEVSNPRLARSRAHTANEKTQRTLKRDTTFHSYGGLLDPETSTSVAENIKMMKNSKCFERIPTVHTYSTLTTRTWTDTDITSSSQVVTKFQQISDPRTSLVFGCPKINQGVNIYDKEWMPKSELAQAQKELILVANCLGTYPTMGDQATKRELMKKLEAAEIVHIATWASLHEGLLLVTSESLTNQFRDSSHLVTVLDILNLNLRAKLIVLSSCGLTPARAGQECFNKLASSFLSAGATCVLVCLWPIPDDILQKFMFNFYLTLRNGEFISEALSQGVKSIQNDGRWDHVCHWATFAMIGKDTRVNISIIKHAQLDQILDKSQKMVDSKSDKPVLNPKVTASHVASKEKNVTTLQNCVKHLLLDHYRNPQIIPGLADLLGSSLKRLHTWVDNDQPDQLSENINGSHHAMTLLKWLGFHFQARGAHFTHPYIMFPHWDMDNMLRPAYDALRATTELVSSPACVNALCESLPLTQKKLSSLIDLISITNHAPEIQLRVTDLSVHPLWNCTTTRTLLSTVGFHQVGTLLAFNLRTFEKQLLVSMLEVLLTFSCSKSPVLLSKLDVGQLGHAEDTTKSQETSFHQLPSLKPILLPRNQLRMSTPWLSVTELGDEMHEKMKLARSTTDLSKDYLRHKQRAKTWHQMSLFAQANEILDTSGKPSSVPKLKIKVKSGSTLSQQRIPVDEKRLLTRGEIQQRRDHAQFTLQERLQDIEYRRRDGIVKLFLPYIKHNVATM